MIITETEKLYSPLNFYLRDNDMREHYDGDYWRDDLSHYEARDYLDALDLFLRRDRDTLDKTRGMMEYYDSGSVNDKVHSLFPTTEFHEGKLWCVAELTLTAPLTREEMAELKDWWVGQLADGWGEGIEQREIKVDRGGLYMEPWTSDGGFFLDTREQFDDRLGIRVPPDITIEPATPPPVVEPMKPEALPDPTGRGYLFVVTDDSDYIVPNALHVQRDDSMDIYPDDESAAEAAEADGVELIYGMPDVPDGVYLDTPENRAVIEEHFNTRDELLAQIAKRHCRFETLETRSRDSLDFHEVSVWGMKSALEEAYNAGIAHQRARTKDADRLGADGVARESSPSTLEVLTQRLYERLDQNFRDYKANALRLSSSEVFDDAAEIAAVCQSYEFFRNEHTVTAEQAELLLKYADPLDFISDCWINSPVADANDIINILAEREQTHSGFYERASEEPVPASAALGRTTTEAGEKSSVLDRIRQHAEEQRDRPPAPKDKADRKKSGPEL